MINIEFLNWYKFLIYYLNYHIIPYDLELLFHVPNKYAYCPLGQIAGTKWRN